MFSIDFEGEIHFHQMENPQDLLWIYIVVRCNTHSSSHFSHSSLTFSDSGQRNFGECINGS